MTITIKEHAPGSNLESFLRFDSQLYQADPHWVPPLKRLMRSQLSPEHNPFFEHAEATFFTAWQDGRPMGRCSAQIDHEHLRLHHDDTGFFGFFDTVNDVAVARSLLDAAEGWLLARGMKRMRGPFSLSINDEVGTLVEGFESAPVFRMPYHRPYQGPLIQQAGLQKAKDLWAWRYDGGELPQRAVRAWEAVQAMSEVSFRSVQVRHLTQELPRIMEVFNDAWRDNWGFVPLTPREVQKMGHDLRLIIDGDLAFIVEIDGRTAGICVAVPNLNEATHDMRGRLFPTGALKLLWRLKVRRLNSVRLMILGLRPEFRRIRRYGPLSTAMYVEIHKRGLQRGYEWGELSWTLEDNRPVNLGIRAMGGDLYKKYRLYEKVITNVGSECCAAGRNPSSVQTEMTGAS